MAYGYFNNEAQCNSYFDNERVDSRYWEGIEEKQKETVMTMAYNRLYYCGLFSLPTPAAATADQLVILKKAQAEMAYYFLQHLNDEDKRKNLQAQGVIAAGIVKENYDKDMLEEVPVPAIVKGMLKAFKTRKAMRTFVLERNENDSSDYLS